MRGGVRGEKSIFDDISTDDIILAFFPCIRFENQIMLSFRGQSHGMEDWSDKQKMINDMDLLDDLNVNYKAVNNMFIICIDRGLRLIMENPYSEEHFLRRYWCMSPAIIDRDRRMNGDYVKKPTQYWFLNCKPSNNLVFEALDWVEFDAADALRNMNKEMAEMMGARTIKHARSMIHPQYANRFIRQYIL